MYEYDSSFTVEITDYRANRILYDIKGIEDEMSTDDFYVVLSEIYYPLGWKAKVDGKVTEINRVNYTLRGVKIPGGTKTIELYYDLESFKTLSLVSIASSFSILLLFFGFIYLSVFKRKDE